MERRWYLGLTAGTIRPTLAAYAADLNLTHAQAIEQVTRVNRVIATAEAQLARVDDYALYFYDACRKQDANPAGAAQPMPFSVWLAAQEALSRPRHTDDADTDTTADGIVIPDDGGDE